MAEPRRVQVACLSPSGPLHPSVPKRPQSDEPEAPATIRIELTLFEPDQKKCPEFSYPELLRKVRGGGKKRSASEKKKTVNPFDDEEAEKEELADIAQRFEEKYGGKKRRRDRMQDLIDMGYGYDESDSFIDNSEAYDELVPASLSTKFGGFYINAGTLQFRQASESEDEAVKEKKKSSTKKIKDRGDKLKKKKREEDKKSKKSKYPKTCFTALNGTKDKKKKNSINLSDMLARFQKEKESQKVKSASPSVASTLKPSTTTPAPQIPPTPPQEAEPAPDPLLSTLVSETELLQAASAIESLSEKDLEQLVNNAADKQDTGQKASPAIEEFKKPPSLPDGLPSPLEKRIKELTKAVRVSEGDKKTIPFTQEMNRALLDIYLLSRDLPSTLHSAVFTHLSSVLPCSKDTLVKWASRLYLHKQGGPIWEPLRKLKDAIAKAMPEQINKYHEECKVHNQSKYAKMLEEEKEKEQKAGSEEEEEEEKSNKKSASPRKKFQWNEEIRQLLCQLFRMKVEMFETEGSSLLSLEDYLKSFLDVEVKPLWPRGWMQARTLFKETRRVYPQLSSIIAKNRALVSPKLKAKEPSNKKSGSPHSENAGTAPVTANVSAKDHPAPSSTASLPQPGASNFHTYTQDNSLDGDLIHNPPSLDGVSEHLTALANRSTSLGLDVSTSRSGPLEKSIVVEEKRKPCPPLPSPSVPTITQQPPRGYLVNQSVHLGPEKKLMSSNHNPRPPLPPPLPPPPESHPAKLKQQLHHGALKSTPLNNVSLQPSVKLYQMTNQQGKGNHLHPTQSGNLRVSAPSPPQRPTAPQTKPSKPQGFHSTPSTTSGTHKPVMTPGFVGKHPASGSNQQVYRPPAHRHPVPPSSNSGSAGGQNTSASASPSPSSSALPRGSTVPVKKPMLPPQKLTLVAPQDTGGGTQGVAKLLTSSMVTGAGGNAASPANITSAKSSIGSGLLTPGQSLTVLTPSYKPNSGKLPTQTSLGILSPIHTFPLHVISFTTDPVPKATAPGDAIVTGPAPGTFHHGLPRNLLGGLHPATKHHPASVPHSGLPAHVQPGQTDGVHLHGKGPSGPQRKL